jgi:hypothetical protein
MTTQTLKGLKNLAPLHWRGDRAGFTSFNPAFASLLGSSQLTPADMDAFAQFVETMNLPPNPNQQLDRTLPPTHAGGNPAAGMNTFRTEPYTSTITCNMCHKVDPGPGTDKTFTSGPVMQQPQTMKVPQLRTLYQKRFFNTASGAASLDGFGLTHDGTDPGLFAFISRPVFTNFTNDTVRKTNISAFLLCLDTGTAPAVGFTRTVTATNVADPAVTNDWTVLQSQAVASNIDLIAKGTVDGEQRGLVYDPVSNSYLSDKTGVGPFSQAELQAKIAAGDILSITGVPLGSGVRMGIDRDLDGRLDGDPLVVAALP